MARFRYTAVDAQGKPVRGTVEAASAAAVADRFYDQGQLLLNAVQIGEGGGFLDFLQADITLSRGLPKSVLANLTRELSVMLGAGQDIDRALHFLVEITEDRRAKRVLHEVRNRVRGGKPLAASLAEHPRIFSRLYVSMVRAGEAGGQLAPGLARLADLLERESRLAATIQSALTYPALLAIAAIGTIVMLLTYVLPQFTPIFEQAGARLPPATRFLVGLGAVVRAEGVPILTGMLCVVLVLFRLLHQPGPRLVFDRVLAAVPIAGKLVRRAEAARFTRALGNLLSNGVGLVSALATARGVLGNLVAMRVVDSATAQVKSGARLAASLGAGHFFPIQTIHLIQLGEETGRLGEMALRAADIHDDQVRQLVQRLIALLVPAVTIVMGMVVAGIVGSLLVAMLSLNDLAL